LHSSAKSAGFKLFGQETAKKGCAVTRQSSFDTTFTKHEGLAMSWNQTFPLTLVTGGRGFLGNNLVRLLLERGAAVRTLESPADDERPLAGLDVERHRGDLCDPDVARRACEGVACVLHTAGKVHVGWQEQAEQWRINVVGAQNIATAAREAGARMVHVSSVNALGRGTREAPADEDSPWSHELDNPYIVTKREGDQEVLRQVALGLDARIVNPVYMFGPWDWKPSSGRMILKVAGHPLLAAPPGSNDFCDVRDVARGILAAAEHGQTARRYILGGEPLSYQEVWQIIAGVTGGGTVLRLPGPWMTLLLGVGGTLWGEITGHEPDVNCATAQAVVLEHHYSYARAARELGFAPRPARVAIEAAWQWFIEYGYAEQAQKKEPDGATSPFAEGVEALTRFARGLSSDAKS